MSSVVSTGKPAKSFDGSGVHEFRVVAKSKRLGTSQQNFHVISVKNASLRSLQPTVPVM
jgi:hypothetical protein